MADTTTDDQLTKLDVNTQYNGLVVSNDWFCIPASVGTVYARLDPAGTGQTFFYTTATGGSPITDTDGQLVTAPVNFLCKYIIIANDATVDGCEILAVGLNAEITVQSGGTLSGSNIYNATVTVQSGGVSESNYNVSTAYSIASGGLSRNDIFVEPGGCYGTFNNPNISGGTASNIVGDGGSDLNVLSGGVVEGASFPELIKTTSVNPNASKVHVGVYVGAKINLPVGYTSTTYNSINVTNDNPILWGGTWTATVVNGVTVYTNGTDTYNGPVNLLNGATLNIQSPAVVEDLFAAPGSKINIASGGTLQNSMVCSSIVAIPSGATSTNNTYISTTVNMDGTGKSDSDGFYWIPTQSSSASTFTNSNLTKYMPSSGGTTNFNTSTKAGSTTGIDGNVSANIINPTFDAQNGGGIWIYPYGGENDYPCFLPGSLIETVNGNIAVEDLKVGDQVYVMTAEGKKLQPITSVVMGVHHVKPSAFDDVSGYPVCIQKDAIAENVPFKDLLVTQDHCLFFGGKFIPVRILVNGHSVYYDRSQTKYTYYHIETGEHSVIIANGVLTESFLNTANHNVHSGNVISMPKAWSKDAAAPLTIDRAHVEPVFKMIADRAMGEGVADQRGDFLLTYDHDVHLIIDNGQVISRIIDNDKITFVIPKNTRNVRIISRASRPCDTIGPFVDDRRSLGVLIRDITIFNKNKTFNVDTHLRIRKLSGWHDLENSSLRWTDGNAILPVGKYCKDNNSILVLGVVAAGPYLVEEKISIRLAV